MVNREFPNTHTAPLDALEFEVTDLSDARHALDELPPGVGDLEKFAPGYWEKRRRATLPTDRALAGATVEWAIQLPPDLRPRALSAQFPRLANAVAAAWSDRGRALATLEGLLVDRRGGRRGLPQDVMAELQRLNDYLRQAPAAGARMPPQPVAQAAPASVSVSVSPDILERAKRLLESAGYRVIPPGN